MDTIREQENKARNRLLNMLSGDAYWQINKQIMLKIADEIGDKLGRDAGYLITDLISKESYFNQRGDLTEDGFFYNSQENIRRDTRLNSREQRIILQHLEKLDLVETKLKKTNLGITIKHFKIKHINLERLLEKEPYQFSKLEELNKTKEELDRCADLEHPDVQNTDRCLKNEHPDVENMKTNNNKTNNTLLRNVITAPSGLEDTDTINSALDSKNNTSIENQPKEKKYYENKFLTYYNELCYVQKHKNIKSKVYVMITRYIKRLQNGSFGKHLRSSHNDVLDIQWLKQNKLLSWLDHKFTDAEIYKMLDGVNAYFCEDFAPSASKRGLDVMIFNPQTGKSLALWLFLSPPTKKSAMVRTKYPETTKMYRKKAFTGRTFTEKEEREFIIGINRLGDFVEKRKAVFKTYKYRPFYMDGIYQRHAEWIRDTVNISVSPAHVLSSRNGFWTNFKNHLFKETGFNIDVGEEELQQSLKKSDAIIAEKKNKLYLKERWKDRAAAEECGIDVSRTALDPRLDNWGEEVITAFFERDFTADELTEFLTKEKN